MYADVGFLVPAVVEYIMIAFRQMNIQRRKIFAPFTEQVHFQVGDAMGKIANDDQFFCFEKKYLRQQPVEVIFIYACRYPNTGFTKMPCFTHMKISDDQGLFILPK